MHSDAADHTAQQQQLESVTGGQQSAGVGGQQQQQQGDEMTSSKLQQQQQATSSFTAALRAITQHPLQELAPTDFSEDERLQSFGECCVLSTKAASFTRGASLLQSGHHHHQQQQMMLMMNMLQQQHNQQLQQHDGSTSAEDGALKQQQQMMLQGGRDHNLLHQGGGAGIMDGTGDPHHHPHPHPQLQQQQTFGATHITAALSVAAAPPAGEVQAGGARSCSEAELAPVKMRRLQAQARMQILQQQQQQSLAAAAQSLAATKSLLELPGSASSSAAGPDSKKSDAATSDTIGWIQPGRPQPLSTLPMLARSQHDVSRRGLDLIERLRDGDVVDVDDHNHHHHQGQGQGGANNNGGGESLGAQCARSTYAGLRLVQRFCREAACAPPPAVMAAVLDLALCISQDAEDEDSEVRKIQEQQRAQMQQLADHEEQQQHQAASGGGGGGGGRGAGAGTTTTGGGGGGILDSVPIGAASVVPPGQREQMQQQFVASNTAAPRMHQRREAAVQDVSRMATAALEVICACVAYGTAMRGAALRRAVRRLLDLSDIDRERRERAALQQQQQQQQSQNAIGTGFEAAATVGGVGGFGSGMMMMAMMGGGATRTRAAQAQQLSITRFIQQTVHFVVDGPAAPMLLNGCLCAIPPPPPPAATIASASSASNQSGQQPAQQQPPAIAAALASMATGLVRMPPKLTDSEECVVVAATFLAHHHASVVLENRRRAFVLWLATTRGGGGGAAAAAVAAAGLFGATSPEAAMLSAGESLLSLPALDGSAGSIIFSAGATRMKRSVQSRQDLDVLSSSKLAFELCERVLIPKQQQQQSTATQPKSLIADHLTGFAFWAILCDSGLLLRLLEMVFDQQLQPYQSQQQQQQQRLSAAVSLMTSPAGKHDALMADAITPAMAAAGGGKNNSGASSSNSSSFISAPTLDAVCARLGMDSGRVMRLALAAAEACALRATTLLTDSVAGLRRGVRPSSSSPSSAGAGSSSSATSAPPATASSAGAAAVTAGRRLFENDAEEGEEQQHGSTNKDSAFDQLAKKNGVEPVQVDLMQDSAGGGSNDDDGSNSLLGEERTFQQRICLFIAPPEEAETWFKAMETLWTMVSRSSAYRERNNTNHNSYSGASNNSGVDSIDEQQQQQQQRADEFASRSNICLAAATRAILCAEENSMLGRQRKSRATLLAATIARCQTIITEVLLLTVPAESAAASPPHPHQQQRQSSATPGQKQREAAAAPAIDAEADDDDVDLDFVFHCACVLPVQAQHSRVLAKVIRCLLLPSSGMISGGGGGMSLACRILRELGDHHAGTLRAALSNTPIGAVGASIRAQDLALLFSSFFEMCQHNAALLAQEQLLHAIVDRWTQVAATWTRVSPTMRGAIKVINTLGLPGAAPANSFSAASYSATAATATAASSSAAGSTSTALASGGGNMQGAQGGAASQGQQQQQQQQQLSLSQRVTLELNSVWWSLLRVTSAAKGTLIPTISRSSNSSSSNSSGRFLLRAKVVYAATVCLHQLMDLHPAVRSAAQQLQQILHLALQRAMSGTAAHGGGLHHHHHHHGQQQQPQHSSLLSRSRSGFAAPASSGASSSQHQHQTSAAAAAAGAEAAMLASRTVATVAPISAALQFVGVEELAADFMAAPPLLSSARSAWRDDGYRDAALHIARAGAVSSARVSALLDEGALDLVEDGAAAAAAASSGGDASSSLTMLVTARATELMDIWLLRRMLAPYISAKADLADSLSNLPFVTGSPSPDAALFVRTVRGRAVPNAQPQQQQLLLDYFQQRRINSDNAQAFMASWKGQWMALGSDKRELPADVKAASIVMVCTANALKELAKAHHMQQQCAGTATVQQDDSAFASARLVAAQMQRYWDSSMVAVRKQQQQQQQSSASSSMTLHRPIALFLVAASALFPPATSRGQADDEQQQRVERKQIAVYIVHLLRKFGSTWFSILPVSGEMLLRHQESSSAQHQQQQQQVAQTEVLIGKGMKHGLGVQRTSVFMGTQGDERCQEQCKAANVPCLSVGDFVSKIVSAQQQAVAKK